MKKPATLLIILAALLALTWYFNGSKTRRFHGAAGGAANRELLVPDFPVNDVRSFRVQEADKIVNVALKDGKWRVQERDGYPASFDKIKRALGSLQEVKAGRKVVVHQKALEDVRALRPEKSPYDHAGLLVETFNEKGGALASFVIGANVNTSGGASAGDFMSGSPEQRFVRVFADDNAAKDEYTLWQVSDSLYEFLIEANEWIDKSFIDVKKIKDIAITALNPADSWSAHRADENASFTFVESKDGAELDTAKAGGLGFLLANSNFNDVLTKDKIKPDTMKNAVKAKINTFEGFHYEIEVAEKKDAAPAKAEMAAGGKSLLTVKVSADINKTRKPEPNEKEEDKKKKDEEFNASVKQLEEKLAKEKTYEGWVYELSADSVSVLNKKRSEVIRDKAADKDKPPTPAGAPAINLPGLPPAASLPTPPAAAPATPVPAKPDEPKPEGAK